MSHSQGLDPSPKNGILKMVKKVFDRPDGFIDQNETGRSNVDPLSSFTPEEQGTTTKITECILSHFGISCKVGSVFVAPVPHITTGANNA